MTLLNTRLLTAWFLITCLAPAASAQTIASNFVLTDRETQEAYALTDLAGEVIVLDFFAYWCGPCQDSSPILEQEVAEYFSAQNGNVHGIPVRVIPVNIEDRNSSATDAFVETYGLSHVADDRDGSVWGGAFYRQFGLGFIPHFVVINGVEDSTHYAQWEVLHSNYGFPGSTFFRNLINTVDGTPSTEGGSGPRIEQIQCTKEGYVVLAIPESRTDNRYYLDWDAGDENWQTVDPHGLLGNGAVRLLIDVPGDPAPDFRRYRVRAVAE